MRRWLPLAILGVILALVPLPLGDSYLFGFVVLVGIFAIAAMGVDLVLGYAGQITLGHAGFMAIGAYTTAVLTVRGVPSLAAFLAACVVTAVIAYLVGAPLMGVLTHFHVAIATLALGVLVYSFLLVGGDLTGGFTGIQGVPRLSLGGLEVNGDFAHYVVVWAAALSLYVLARNVGDSQVGRILRAIESDEVAAQTSGISVASYKVRVFVLSAIYASIAGSLLAHYMKYISPTQVDILTSFDLVTMTILGGKGTVLGGILGAAFLKLLPQFTEFLKDYRVLVNGSIVLIVLLFFPRGIVGGLEALAALLARPMRKKEEAPLQSPSAVAGLLEEKE
ncbi:MAG TPA: branched-chain amino acid ABC transporter permease [Dehalococcoidia bacterium]|nr:branched-chain amino acid ABC transporter permease [Dehalococcoidia bacterium]